MTTARELIDNTIKKWNDEADSLNQWGVLGLDEMLEMVAEAALTLPVQPVQPLTDLRIAQIFEAETGFIMAESDMALLDFARAIEAASVQPKGTKDGL